MEQLIRTKSGPFNLEDSFSLIEAHDIFQSWKASSDEERIRKLLRPLEDMLVDLPKIEVKDSAVDAICHGADLAIPGISAVSKKLKRGQYLSWRCQIISFQESKMCFILFLKSQNHLLLKLEK